MRKNLLPFFAILLVFAFKIQAQETPVSKNYFQISPRIGYDFPTYNNSTPYVDYKGGLLLGISFDYYWSWFGLGLDLDYIQNQPNSSYPTQNLINASTVNLTDFSTSEDKITRDFYGFGPSFKYQTKSRKFTAELNLRGGYGSITGGKTALRETTTTDNQLLNFHAGYNTGLVFSTKGQVRFTYYFSKHWGVHIGAYYMRHYKAKERVDKTLGFAAAYQAFTHNPDTNENTLAATTLDTREEPCDCDVYSKGVFVGLSIRFPAKPKVKEEEKAPIVVYALSIKAKDKFTKENLPNTEIVVKDAKGIEVLKGKTNDIGVLLLENVLPDDYTIEGALNKVKLEPTVIKKSEFIANKTLEKEIIYSDANIILLGTAVVCETTKPIPGVTVILKKASGVVENIAVTDSIGHFSFPLKPNMEYYIYGKKATYFSQIVNIPSQQLDRNVTLYVKVELCMEETDCEKAIKLKNILYDLDKYFIREESKKELNRLVQFMVDNPDVKVEVSSHTDCRASNAYNQTLSQNRANAAVDYIVSQGIVRERLKGVGYGESKLLNECADGVQCTEEQHQLNRRTEMKVICPPKK